MTARRPLRPLTADERDRAAVELPLAYHFAWKCKSTILHFGWDAVSSAAHLAMVEAVQTYDAACGPWPAWVGLVVRRHVSHLWTAAGRLKRRPLASLDAPLADGNGTVADTVPDPGRPGWAAADDADAVAWVRRQLARLPAPEAAAVAAYCLDPARPPLGAVGKKQQVTKEMVRVRVAQATERLRRAA